MITIRATSHQIMSRRLARRSTSAPAGRAMSANAAVAAAVSRPTWNVDARRTTTAVSGSASWVTEEPISLTDWPLHSSRKFRCCHRDPVRPGALVRPVTQVRTALLCPAGRRLSNRDTVVGYRFAGTTGRKEDDAVPAMKLTPIAAMRARDVSRPRAEHLAEAETAEAARAAPRAAPAGGDEGRK